MAVNDNDLELLHAYLDGELPVADCEGLWRRLAIERDLMAELERVRSDLSMRSMVWSSLEPDDKSVIRLEAKVMRAARRDDLLSWSSNALRIATSAAALILFGFTVGWLGKDRYNGALPVVTHVSPAPNGVVPAGSIDSSPGSGSKTYVTIRDPAGKVIAVQQFDSAEEAQQFVRDVEREQNNPSGDVEISPVPNRF